MAQLYKEGNTTILRTTDGYLIPLCDVDETGELCWGFFWYRIGNRYGFMNELGDVIAEADFLECTNFSRSGHAAVRLTTGWGFIDRLGRMVVMPKYQKVWYFNNGYAKAITKKGQIVYLNSLGAEVSPVYPGCYCERVWEAPPNPNLPGN